MVGLRSYPMPSVRKVFFMSDTYAPHLTVSVVGQLVSSPCLGVLVNWVLCSDVQLFDQLFSCFRPSIFRFPWIFYDFSWFLLIFFKPHPSFAESVIPMGPTTNALVHWPVSTNPCFRHLAAFCKIFTIFFWIRSSSCDFPAISTVRLM